MELRHLKYFVAVAQAGSLNAAALKLNIAQPPLGRQIRDLEQAVGVRLFDRSTKGLALTQAGQVFLRRAEAILRSTEMAMHEAVSVAKGGRGHLVVGFADEFMYGRLPDAASRFMTENPGVGIELELDYSARVAEDVSEGKADVGLIVSPPPSHLGDLVVRMLDRMPMLVAMAADHPLAGRAAVSLKELAGEHLLVGRLYPTGGYYVQLMSALRNADITPRIVPGVWPSEIMASLIAAGHGVALVCSEAISPVRSDVKLVPVMEKDALFERCVVWRPDLIDATGRQFIDFLAPRLFSE